MILFSLLKDAEMVILLSIFWYQFWDCMNFQMALEHTWKWSCEVWSGRWASTFYFALYKKWDVRSRLINRLYGSSFLWCLFVNLSISIFGNKVRTTMFQVSSFSISAFFLLKEVILYGFLKLWILKKKCCKYNSINYIETIKKERIKNIFVRESVPSSLMLCGRRRESNMKPGSYWDGRTPSCQGDPGKS